MLVEDPFTSDEAHCCCQNCHSGNCDSGCTCGTSCNCSACDCHHGSH